MTPRGLPGIRSIQTKPFLLHAVGLICSQRCQEEYICQAPSTETSSCCYASFLSATLPIAHILCISTSAEWVMHMKGAAFPAEMPLILGIRCLTLVCFIPALQHPLLSGLDPWLVIIAENSSHTARLCACSFPCMHLHLRKRFWPCIFSPELPVNWHQQSNHNVNYLPEGRYLAVKHRTEKG